MAAGQEDGDPVFGGVQGVEGAEAGGGGAALKGDGVAVLLELFVGEEEDGGTGNGVGAFIEGVQGRGAAAYMHFQLGVVGGGQSFNKPLVNLFGEPVPRGNQWLAAITPDD